VIVTHFPYCFATEVIAASKSINYLLLICNNMNERTNVIT